MPDLDLQAAPGPMRVYELLHDARPVLLELSGPGTFDLSPWADRAVRVDATTDGPWDLPVIGGSRGQARHAITPGRGGEVQ